MSKPLEQIKSELLECAQAWDGESRLLGNVRADEIVKLLHAFDFAGWTSEVPTEEGHYLFIGKIRFEYADNMTEYTNAQSARVWPDDNYVCFAGSGADAELHTANGLWYRINYPDPPKD